MHTPVKIELTCTKKAGSKWQYSLFKAYKLMPAWKMTSAQQLAVCLGPR